MHIRALREDDVEVLVKFGEELSQRSKELFCPYPWADIALLRERLKEAILNSLRGVDSSYLALEAGEIIGHFFLWKVGGNQLSSRFGVEVPELGIAIADSHQGIGIGYQCVQFLQELARDKGRDAIELTTALDNSSGWKTYLKAGFEHVGNILNPLEVDTTEVALGEVTATKFRKERQMAYVINEDRRENILKYLALKRAQPNRS